MFGRRFTKEIYEHHETILRMKFDSAPCVVDMSVLWLWWVAHHEVAGWATGRPWLPLNKGDQTSVTDLTSDAAFSFTKGLPLPAVDKSLALCNGMDVVNRTVYDHMHAYKYGDDFSLNAHGGGVPSVKGACLRSGGVPESLDPQEAKLLDSQTLFLNNIHYQGGDKGHLKGHICEVLTQSGSKRIRSGRVHKICHGHRMRRRRLTRNESID